MKILHVIQTLDPSAGGPPVVAARLAAAQAALGHSVTALAEVPGGARSLADIPGVQIVKAPMIPRRQAVLGGQMVNSLRPLLREQDVLHLHGIWDVLLYATAGLAPSVSKPYVVVPHGMLDPWSMRQSYWKKRLALAFGWRRMLDRAAAIHWLNTDEQTLAAPVGITAPGVVIPNGVNLDEFVDVTPLDAGRRNDLFPGLGDRPYILFLSRLHYKKGLDYLADALRLLTEGGNNTVHLVVAGPDDGARGDFERRIAAAGLTGRVHLPGPIYGRERLGLLAGAACFVLPSRQEGFSVAILEALACGTPAVVSRDCHFPEVAEAGAGEVVPLDAAAVAAALGRVLADQALRERMGKAGRELVAKRFTWSRIAAQTIEVYSRFVHGTHDSN
jgi:glycosyltransferase involved in cell wall biosynthesis